ncbi:MAG: prolipoprotein diacylglyceryl transferase [Sulfuricella sp.]|nr:prolipoprotein diacylglyceryl transferase [Sulfuricella sp.]
MIPNLDPHLVHSVFEALGIFLGVRYYWALRRAASGQGMLSGSNYAVLVGCLLGAAIGNKAVFWIEMPHLFADHAQGIGLLLSGQSLVGGMLGGLIGVEIAKLASGHRQSTGDLFVFPVLLGIMVGRIGCFLAGLDDATYGIPTALPWGVDFGDGIPRHPTQLYEIAFAALLWRGLARLKPTLAGQPGLLFKLLLASYLAWRLGVDFLKPVPYVYPLGLSGIQWVCGVALCLYLPLVRQQWLQLARRTT